MFKKITLSILCVFSISLISKAQTSFDDDSLWTSGDVAAPGDYVDLFAHTNIRSGSSPDTFVWTRMNVVVPANWTTAVCDVNQCWGETIGTQDFIIAPNTVKELSFHFYPKSFAGTGKMTVRFAKKSNPSSYVDIVINCTANSLSGIARVQKSLLNIFPNPAVKTITITDNKVNSGVFEIVNILGEAVLTGDFDATGKIDVSTLRKGLYFINVKNGAFSATNKLVIE
jgi:hypothetical protein